MSAARQLDLQGSLTGGNAVGQRIDFQFDGPRVRVELSSLRAGLAALPALRSLARLPAPGLLGRNLAEAFVFPAIELTVAGRLVGRAGQGAQSNWIGRRVSNIPLELHWFALVRAGIRNF